MPGPSRPPAGVAVARGRDPLTVAVAALFAPALPARCTDRVNVFPGSPNRPAPATAPPRDQTEGKFQLSFKCKLADFDDSIGASLRAGYTQQSPWQVYNPEVSRPFRETNGSSAAMARAWSTTTGNRTSSASASRSPPGCERSAAR